MRGARCGRNWRSQLRQNMDVHSWYVYIHAIICNVDFPSPQVLYSVTFNFNARFDCKSLVMKFLKAYESSLKNVHLINV